ncbi:LysR family transcriptional regulator [Vibrio parahaemolyticus]|nr:LysR family transcriptional regulator [Vibrio parahaemolyticus]NWK17744.1 LysR family transcriptional regulator [Vibrio parahaemolyticus]
MKDLETMRSLPPLNALKTFESAAKHLNFTNAANDLNVTQGAVSRQVKQLEDYLGVDLFMRKKGRLTLSEAGERLNTTIIHAFGIIENEVESLKSPNKFQTLNVLVPPTFATRWLAPRLVSFFEEYPNTEVQIYTERENSLSFDVEILFENIRPVEQKNEVLFRERYIAVCSKPNIIDSMLLRSMTNKMIHIRHHGMQLPSWDDWMESAGLEYDSDRCNGIVFSTQEQAISAAVSGLGFAIVDRGMVRNELMLGLLHQFDPLIVQSKYGYTLNIPLNKRGVSKVDRFTEWLRLVIENEIGTLN